MADKMPGLFKVLVSDSWILRNGFIRFLLTCSND